MAHHQEITSKLTRIDSRKPLFLNRLVVSILVFCSVLFTVPQATSQTVNDLWIYVLNNRADQVEQLLRRGLDPNTTSDQGNPIIMQSVRDDSWAVFDVILKHPNTDVKILNGYQETPLMYVSLMGDLPRAKALIKRGAVINHLGWTPLHYAASKGQLAMVTYLLSQGAMPNAPSPTGAGPIMMAASAGATAVVQALLDAGADPAAVNINGENAAVAARNAKHSRLADALDEIIRKR